MHNTTNTAPYTIKPADIAAEVNGTTSAVGSATAATTGSATTIANSTTVTGTSIAHKGVTTAAVGGSSKVNEKIKDRLFKFVFGNPDNKEWTLSLYNAMNGSTYTDADAVSLNTIENVVYLGMQNDVSFLLYNTMNLYEQQSTFNPNMPMRFLIYAGMLYSKYIQQNEDYHRYSSALQKAPMPKCVCFYNGKGEKDDRLVLKLSDAFKAFSQKGSKEGTGSDGSGGDITTDIEVRVTMVNINYGHNRELLEACKPLKEYSWFIQRIREVQNQKKSLEDSIDVAINEMPDDFVIKPFIILHRAEVKHMCITEYDEERTLAEMKEDGRKEGRAEGREELAELISVLLDQGRIEDAKRLAKDIEFRDGLLAEFGIGTANG